MMRVLIQLQTQLVKKKSKSLLFLFIIVTSSFFSVSFILNSKEGIKFSGKGTQVYSELRNEFQVLEKIYGDRLFFGIPIPEDELELRVLQCDTLSTCVYEGITAGVLRVEVESPYDVVINNRIEDSLSFSFHFFFVGSRIYRLSGFTTSNIRFLVFHKEGSGIKALSSCLVEAGMLQINEVREFKKFLLGTDEFNKRFNQFSSVVVAKVVDEKVQTSLKYTSFLPTMRPFTTLSY